MKEFDYNSQKWRTKSAKIKRRDGYKCVWCARYGKSRPAVVVHHIKHAEEYPELTYVNDNLVSLCQACHNKAHPEKARKSNRIRYPPTPGVKNTFLALLVGVTFSNSEPNFDKRGAVYD